LAPGQAPRARHGGPAQLRDPERYQIIGEHGRGGLGRVSRAHDHDLGRDIAIKELISRGHVSEVRFLREALITARLEHPGIVPIYEAGRWPDGTPFYAMKLVAGRPLRDLIAERASVDERIGLLHHVIAVADAIAYAHGRNIIHRDLKPANVIIGDFGETIVIDWGLAKDLTTTEESTVGGGPFRANRDDGLTATGSVLGTPTYMAPEQERGEHVDQRADVFAIGAMLWELCALQRVPPAEPHLRHRMLHRAGIDGDLVTIIDKALERDRTRRYPDAGALASDLKAFKSGARIAARSYSLFAMLAHWTRRHRTLALSVTAVTALAAIGIVTYVRHIAAERDHVAAANNALTLEHAELMLHSDPTAAFELLESYKGIDMNRQAMLRAEARGLGVAQLRVTPHTQGVYFARALVDGVLVTLSTDGIVAKTSPDGTSRVIARDITPQHTFDYADSRRLLAYACETDAICLLDVQAERTRQPPADTSSFAPVAIALSPSGDLLAAISAHGDMFIWQLSDDGKAVMRFKAHLDHGASLKFVDDHTLATRSQDRIRIFHLDTAGGSAAASSDLLVSNADGLSANAELHLITVTTSTGDLAIIDSTSDQIVQHETVCKGYLNATFTLPSRSAVGFACQDGDVGIWDLKQKSSIILAHVEGGTSTITGSADGRYLIAGGGNGLLLVHDFTTCISSSYRGHATRLTALLPPSSSFRYIVSGDTTGEVRKWPLPDSAVRVAMDTKARMFRAIQLADDGPLIAIGNSSTIPWRTRAGASGELPDHNPAHAAITMSTKQRRVALYGSDDEIELWSFGTRSTKRTIRTEHGTTSAAVYTSDGTRFITGSRDGMMTEWQLEADTHRDLGSVHEPIDFLRSLPNTETIIVGGKSGTLWLSDNGRLSHLGKESAPIFSVATSYDSRWLAIGTSRGIVHLYNLATREVSTIPGYRPWIEFLAFSPDSRELAIATDKRISLTALPELMIDHTSGTSDHINWHWKEVALSVGHFAFSRDGRWFGTTSDHGIWFNRREDNHWIYVLIGTTRVSSGSFSEDSMSFIATDTSGRALVVDMNASIFN
jgi:WD40 repeat protein